MVRAYSINLRERVLAAVLNEGMSARGAVRDFGKLRDQVGEASPADRGTVAPARIRGHKPRLLVGELRNRLLERTRSDCTLRGLVAELAMRGVKADYVQVWRFAHAEGLSFKNAFFPLNS